MATLVEKNIEDDEIIEAVAPEGIYYKDDNGNQGFVPRAQNTNPFKLSEEQMIEKEILVKRIMLDFPEIDDGMVDFATMFYLSDPDRFEEIIDESKKSKEPSRYTKSISKMKKTHEQLNNNGKPLYLGDGLDKDFDIINE